MSTTGNEALESIKNERKGFNMTRDIVNLNIDIPDDINIKDIKLNDKQYLAKRYGV